jgi:hypothetical protein
LILWAEMLTNLNMELDEQILDWQRRGGSDYSEVKVYKPQFLPPSAIRRAGAKTREPIAALGRRELTPGAPSVESSMTASGRGHMRAGQRP